MTEGRSPSVEPKEAWWERERGVLLVRPGVDGMSMEELLCFLTTVNLHTLLVVIAGSTPMMNTSLKGV